MTQYKKKYERMRAWNIFLSVMLILCLALIIVLMLGMVHGKPAENELQQPQDTQQTARTEATQTPVADVTEDSEAPETEALQSPETEVPWQEDETMLWIDTPYVKLGFPAEWESYLKYEKNNEGGVFTVSFRGDIAEELIPLFDIHFGSEETGELIGYLTVGGEKIAVCVTPYDCMADEGWREDDQFVLYAMQEGINSVIQSIMADPTYTAQ